MNTMKQVIDDLESNNPELLEEFKTKIREQFKKTNDPWLLNGFYDYHLRTQSQRAVDILAIVSEPHDGFFLRRMLEGLKSPTKLPHLTLLGYLVRRRPMWIYKIFQHEVSAQLLHILKVESDIVTIVSALLILNILIPLVPISVGPILPEIFSVFSKLAARNCNSNNYQDAQLVHLQISLYTLFHRLYGMFPNNFINFLRKEYMTNETYPVFSHTVKPMLDTVRVNHLLITGDENWEKSSERWRNVEPHDIIASCATFLMNGGNSGKEIHQRSVYEPKSVFNCGDLLGVVKVTGKQTVAEYCKELGKGADDPTLLSPSVRFLEKRPPESVPAQIPLTPIIRGFEVSSPYSEHEGSSPPEAAVEATPETTPIRECLTTTNTSGLFSAAGRPLSSLIKDNIQQGAIVPMSERSFPTSPIKKDSPTVRHSAPEIILHGSQLQSYRKINMLLSDRIQVSEPNNVVELKPVVSDAAKNTNDLISENRTQSVISSANTSKSINCASDRKENGTVSVDKSDVAPDSIEEFDPCALEKSGSPCSSGGLHMPDQKLMGNFALYMQHMRHRQHSQCTSDSERFSPSNSPQDRVNYFKNSKVRRTNSCPEMKKGSPNSTTLSSDSPVLEERDENEEFYDNKKHTSSRRKLKKSIPLKVTVETQTDDLPPQTQYPYEHLFLDVFPPLHPPQADGQSSPTESVNSLEERPSMAKVFEKADTPSKLLQKYIDTAALCFDDKLALRDTSKPPSIVLENKYLLDQLRLMGVVLELEEHKREVHAERNRRLLPRSRRNKTLEEHNNILLAQVTDLQKQVNHCQEEVAKIIREKDALIEQEKRNCTHWRTQFGTLQQEHKTLTSRYQNVEALLKEERDSNEQNLKQLNDTRATLGDITNDLRSCQKDAMEAKDLRRTIAELQHEMIKAGELITLFRNRLIEASLPTEDKVTTDSAIHSLIDERNRLLKIVSDQRISLEATRKSLDLLRKDTKNKENQVEVLSDESISSQESLENIIKDWKKKYEEMKASYDQEKLRSANFESQVNRFKLLMKSSHTKIAAQKETALRRGLIPLADDGGGPSGAGLKLGQSVPKSPKTFAHSASQQVKLAKESEKFPSPISEANRSRTSPPTDQSNERESPSRAQVENPPSPAPATFVAQGSVDGEGSGSSDVFKSIVKKKGRTECAESGQLRPISFTQFDPEPPTRKE